MAKGLGAVPRLPLQPGSPEPDRSGLIAYPQLMRGAMATYIELQKQIESLQREAETLRAKERKGVIAQMKEAVAAYGISASELGLTSGRGSKAPAPGRKTRTRGAAKRNGGSTAYA